MPSNEPIRGDDAAWKRRVDDAIINIQNQLITIKQQIAYLQKRAK